MAAPLTALPPVPVRLWQRHGTPSGSVRGVICSSRRPPTHDPPPPSCILQAVAVHGDASQQQRTKAVEQFKLGQIPLLVATDVAARGLDIPDVEAVINYSFPLTTEDYVHRIGRTGRAGKTGSTLAGRLSTAC